jgi:hypothetical protein
MTAIPRTVVLALLIGTSAGLGCARRVDLEQVPIGTPVEVTRQDGGVVRGTLTARDDRAVRMKVGPKTHSIPRDQIAGVQLVNGDAPAVLLASAKFREFTVPEGTVLTAHLDSAMASDTNRIDDPIAATLTEPLLIDGVEILPAGSIVTGAVSSVEASGKVTGRASLVLRFRSIAIAGRGETYPLSASLHYRAASTKGDDAKTIGIPAGVGAVIGAIVGGGKGAGIGAAIGGGAGAAVVLTTSGDEVRLARGTAVSLTLDQAADVRVPIKR